jgi:hypothetical protein
MSIIDLEAKKARNDYAGEGQQQFNHLTDRLFAAMS